MTNEPERIEFLLLDLHLQQLEPDEASRVQEAVAASADLAEKNDRLGEVLALLDRCSVPQARPGLAEAVLARVDAQSAVYPFERPTPRVSMESARDLATSAVLSLRELVAIAACITLFVGIFVPGYFKAQNIAVRNRCLDNLRQIYAGTTEYAAANKGNMAWCGFNPGASWLPTRAPNVKRFSNTAQAYVLLKGGPNKAYVRDTVLFICPASPNGRPMRPDGDDFAAFNDFPEPANTTYSYRFDNTPRPVKLAEIPTGMGLAGDHNPFFDANAAGSLNPYDEASGNSPAHGVGAGQNVVSVSGGAGWFRQPTVGVDGDNVYRAGKLGRYLGNETPICPTDTLMVP